MGGCVAARQIRAQVGVSGRGCKEWVAWRPYCCASDFSEQPHVLLLSIQI